jgi:hypothetical protein
MSHVPESPGLYVCRDCQNVVAGDVSDGSGQEGHSYSTPSECGACGNTEFVKLGDYPQTS